MLFSVAIAVHNEEKNIIRCLQSIYDWANEIVIVDGRSTDKTIDFIRQFDQKNKIHLFKEDNPPMFHQNKQKAIERCRGQWILQLDADEVISENLKKEILTVINQKSEIRNSPVAYRIPRLNYFLNRPLKKGGQYPDYTTRLYKNGFARFPCKTTHEQVEISSKFKIQSLKSSLLHYPYPSFEIYIKKWLRYAMLEAEEFYKNNQPFSFGLFAKYIIFFPIVWFLTTYFRHKGFQDGLPGFIFSLFSSIRYWVIYIKLYELKTKK